jgi:hypothetical protein
MRSLFKWIFRIALALVVLAIVLVVAVLLLLNVIAKSKTEKELRDSTGMDARIAKMDVGVLTPTVHVEGLRLYNTPEFGGGTFLDLPELRFEYVPEDIRNRKWHFKTVRLHLAEVTIVKNKDGKLNAEILKSRTGDEKTKKKRTHEEFQIDTLYVTIGTIKVLDLANPRNNTEYNVALKEAEGHNLKSQKQIEDWLTLQVVLAAAQQASASGKGLDVNTLLRMLGVNAPRIR